MAVDSKEFTVIKEYVIEKDALTVHVIRMINVGDVQTYNNR